VRKPCIVVLGSAAAIPSPSRFVPSVLLMGLRSAILMDIGEGAQIRLQEAGVSVCKIKAVAVTHLHGDHFLGLFPMLQTLTMQSCNPVKLISPSQELCSVISGAQGVSECVVAVHGQSVVVAELAVTPVAVNHGGILAFGYHVSVPIDSKGRRKVGVFYSGDGVCEDECKQCLKQLGVDVIIHDSSFMVADIGRAIASGHATSLDAAKLANELNAKLLVLTHLSARYSDPRSVVSDARRVFQNVIVARDLMTIPLSYYAQPC